jgi:hypothetical protein
MLFCHPNTVCLRSAHKGSIHFRSDYGFKEKSYDDAQICAWQTYSLIHIQTLHIPAFQCENKTVSGFGKKQQKKV